MTSFGKYACALILAGGLAAPAYAAATGMATPGSTGDATSAGQSATVNQTRPNGAVNSPSTNGQNAMQVGQKLRSDLSKAGYTDISVAPSSFVVHAKNSGGNPVMMVISPNSVTAITEENGASNSASSANRTGAGTNTTAGSTMPGKSGAPTKP